MAARIQDNMSGKEHNTLSTEAYRRQKWETLFNYLDVKRDGIFDHDELMSFPTSLINAGMKEYAERLKTSYEGVWSRICKTSKLPEGTFTLKKQEWIDGMEVLRKDNFFIKDFVPTISEVYFKVVDEDGDGFISFDEWRRFHGYRGMYDETVLQDGFRKMDRDGDGKISREEVRYGFTQFNLGEDPNDDYSFLYHIS